MLTDDARHEDVPPSLDLNRVFKKYHALKGMMEVNSQKK